MFLEGVLVVYWDQGPCSFFLWKDFSHFFVKAISQCHEQCKTISKVVEFFKNMAYPSSIKIFPIGSWITRSN